MRGLDDLPLRSLPIPSPDTAPPSHQDVQALPAVLGVHTLQGRRSGPSWPQDWQTQGLGVLHSLFHFPLVPWLGWDGIGGKERSSTPDPVEEGTPVLFSPKDPSQGLGALPCSPTPPLPPPPQSTDTCMVMSLLKAMACGNLSPGRGTHLQKAQPGPSTPAGPASCSPLTRR